MKKVKPTLVGTLRIKTKDLKVYEYSSKGWKISKKDFSNAMPLIKSFKKHRSFNILVDKVHPEFLKGQYYKGQEQGARINVLPDGQVLEKAFSLFSPDLVMHDQDSHDHWDIMYQNKGGGFSYVYTLEKRFNHKNMKYKKVEEFEKVYPKLKSTVKKALKDKNDLLALPMFTLLNTYMRVGNEIYYKTHGHKGLTTLKKGDIKIKGNEVTFDYIGKDNVPLKITKKFPAEYVNRLKNSINKKKNTDFVFTNNGKLLHGNDFKKAFSEYCGKEFYPHIVRSHYATTTVKDFLKKNKKASKEDVQVLFTSIAQKLGHKKFSKKTNVWEDSYTITVNSYIQPELAEKVKNLYST